MKLLAFSLLDTKVGSFSPPFFMAHPGAAIRAVMELGQDMNTTVGRHPADFSLVQLGHFEDQTGVMHAETPIHLGTVASLLPAPAAQLPFFPNPPVEARPDNSNGLAGGH